LHGEALIKFFAYTSSSSSSSSTTKEVSEHDIKVQKKRDELLREKKELEEHIKISRNDEDWHRKKAAEIGVTNNYEHK
jgi:hypothetical protein